MAANSPSSRREFLRRTGNVAVSSALAGVVLPHVHAAEDSTIQMALIGCGGRGAGAVADACDSMHGPVKLVAMADLYEDRLERAHRALNDKYRRQIQVPRRQRFVGFDAYRAAMDVLRPGDIAILAGYAAWRPQQLEYAVEKGLHVFMEKSFACDPPGLRRVIQAGEVAESRNLKIAAGLMCRHSVNRQELIARIRDGELGEIQLIRTYRMQPVGPLSRRPADRNELEWQIRNFTGFLWVSGGLFAEMNIHQIDELCWIKDSWPYTAHGIGGRAANSRDASQNLDSISVEWTFGDGTKATCTSRWLPNCHDEFATYIHGTRRAAQFSGNIHAGTVQIFKDQRISPGNVEWKAPPEERTAWQAEWDALLRAIREDLPHNEARRAAFSNFADIMGRAAVHTGLEIAWNQVMNSNFQFCPHLEELTADSPAPVQEDDQGRYPVPVPGLWMEL